MTKLDDLRKAAEAALAALAAAEAEAREATWSKIDKLVADGAITKEQIAEHFNIMVATASNKKVSLGEKIGRASPPTTHQDPSNPENKWSSRGRPPRWMQAYLDQGRTKDEFLVK